MGLNLMAKTFYDAIFNKLCTTIKCVRLCYIKEEMQCNALWDIAS